MTAPKLRVCALLALLFCFASNAHAQECQYASFLDALDGGIFSDTSFFKQAVEISGYKVSRQKIIT